MKEIICNEKRVEGISAICDKCETNHTMTFELCNELCVSKQRVREAIEKIRERINDSLDNDCHPQGGDVIDEFEEELGLE